VSALRQIHIIIYILKFHCIHNILCSNCVWIRYTSRPLLFAEDLGVFIRKINAPLCPLKPHFVLIGARPPYVNNTGTKL